jgi:starch synthase
MNNTHSRSLNIMMIAAEAAPLAKVGGLADVVGALPTALRALGHDVRIVIPHYGMMDRSIETPPKPVKADLSDPILVALEPSPTVARTQTPSGTPVYLIGLSRWFRNALQSEDLYTSDPTAYVAFCRAAAVLARDGIEGWVPDIVHGHDWHAGLVPVYNSLLPHAQRRAAVFTVHNLAYAGVFGAEVMATAGLPTTLYTMDGLEYYGGFSFLKAGMVFSDQVNTVSPQYAREVETDEYGGGMAGLVRHLKGQGRFSGILNGIDTGVYDPAADPALPSAYGKDDFGGKAVCKAALQSDCGLEVEPRSPVIGMVSRICEQKGHDLVAAAADAIVGLGAQLVVLGVGDPAMSAALEAAAARHPGRIAVKIGYDAYLAPRIYAGSDMFLMPSRFEPCGLGQLIALRYGSVPVVRRTGGLADTVRDVGEHPRSGNGFVFDDVSQAAMIGALKRACETYRDRTRWNRLTLRGMQEDHDWASTAPKYEALYRKAIRARRSAA